MELQNNEIRSSININKASHRKEMNTFEKLKKKKEAENEQLVEVLTKYRGIFEDKKLS